MDGRNRGHLGDTVDETGDFIAKFPTDFLQLDAAFPHGPIEDGRHQACLIQVQLHQHLGHFDTGAEAAGPRRPEAILLHGSPVDLGTQLTGPPELVRVLQAGLGGNLAHPAFDIHLSVCRNGVVFPYFYHAIAAVAVRSLPDH